MTAAPSALIDAWLGRRVAPERLQWFQALLAQASAGAIPAVSVGFSQLPRRFALGPLELDASEIAQAEVSRPGWQPELWTLDQLGRSRVLLALGELDAARYLAAVSGLFADSDLEEQLALYKSLAILPQPASWTLQAAEGLRSNMKAVFDAVALDNPFPAEQLSPPQFNQLVLKALFVGSPLHRVHGLDGRVNRELAAMLCDYARERWAAGRAVSPELWRCVGPVADAAQLSLMRRPLTQGEPSEQLAAALSLHDNKLAESLLKEHMPLVRRSAAAALSWPQILAWEGPLDRLAAGA